MFTPAPSSTHVRRQSVITATSTVVVNPTSIGSAEESGDSVPIAAIAGGACGGVVLAVLAVIGWKWWGLQIKKKKQQQQQRELEKRLAMARQSSLSNTTTRGRSSRSLSESRRTSSDSSKLRLARPGIQQWPAINPLSDSVPPVPPLPPLDSISTPRPLMKRRSGGASNEKKEVRSDHKDGTALSTAPRNTPRQGTALPKGRSRLGSLDGKSYRPLRPSPLAAGSPSPPSHSPRSADLSFPRQRQEKTTEPEPVAASTTAASQQPPPSSFGPRVKASLSSLPGEARRQSRASSHNSVSDQSRYSGAGGSSRRWSWWSLINGRGLRQVGVGTGKNRISADTSICEEWQEEDPSAPIGYAYSGVDENNNEREPEKQSTNQNGDAFLSSSKLERGA